MAQFPRVIPVGVLNETTGEIIPLKLSAAGALQVDLIELEDVRINLPEGTALDVAVQNTSPIPVSLPEGNVDVEVKNASAVPVSLPEGNVGVEVNNASAIPVSLPEGNVSVEFPEAQEVKNATGAPLETVLQYTFGTAKAEWKPRTGTATIAESASNSDLQNAYGQDLLRIKVPATFTGTAIAVEIATSSEETPAAMKTDNKVVVSIPIVEGDKGLWIGMDQFASVLRGLRYFRLVSNDTEAAARTIQYDLG